MALVFFESASELATLTNTFTVSGTPTDPTTISLTITDPEGTETTYTYAAVQITRTSAGIYTKAITCNKAGTWTYEWVGTGSATDTEVGTWEVLETSLGRLYTSVALLKSQYRDTETADDSEYHESCFAASRSVEQHCERLFYRATGTAYFVPNDPYQLVLADTDVWVGDIVSITSLKTDASGDGTFETTWASTDYRLLPMNAAFGPEIRPYTKIKAIGANTFPLPYTKLARDDRVEIQGIFGWPTIPYGVRRATKLLASELFKLKDAPFGVAGLSEFGVVRIRENPILLKLLHPYVREPVKVA